MRSSTHKAHLNAIIPLSRFGNHIRENIDLHISGDKAFHVNCFSGQ